MRSSLLRLLILVLAVSALALFGRSQTSRADAPLTPEDAITRLFSGEPQAEWFVPAFLSQVPLEQVKAIVAQYRAQLGALQSVRATGSAYEMVFEHGSARATIKQDVSGAISSLLFGAATSNDPAAAKQQALLSLKKLPGKVSLLITANGKETDSRAPDDKLPVGSAFKLAVLAALEDQIAAGKHHWDEVVTLQHDWKSLPSGELQNWPDGTPLTIQTLASLMISISDNTAADALLDIVGRDAAEKYGPANAPFLGTRETFTLKSPRLSSLLERYRAANTAQRRAMLPEIDAQPFDKNAGLAPDTLDIEWFFSARDLCRLLDKVGADAVFAINPGLTDPSQWRSVSYKGGSEPGVLNMSHQLIANDGTKYCVVATWNDPSADADTLAGVLGPLLQSLPH